MSRSLLILALLLSGTGCSATRPHLSAIVVTPPKVSFRSLLREETSGDTWHCTAVAVSYPSESLTPAPCSPSPVRPVELVTFFDEDECAVPLSLSGVIPSVTTVVPDPPVDVPAAVEQVDVPVPVPTAIVSLENATSPPLALLPAPSVAPVSLEFTPLIPSGVLTPVACAPSPGRPLELVTFIQEDEGPTPLTPSEPVPAPPIVHLENATSPPSAPSVALELLETTPSAQTASASTHLDLPVLVESPPPTESHGQPATGIALLSPVETHSEIQSNQAVVASLEVLQEAPVQTLSMPSPVPSDLSELLTEIRQQRQLIEALQRELTRERSADDEAIEELEAAVENLLVQTKTTHSEMPTTLRK